MVTFILGFILIAGAGFIVTAAKTIAGAVHAFPDKLSQ